METERRGDSNSSPEKATSAVANIGTTSASIISEVTIEDVLLGRGNGVKNWAGNLRYRNLIRSHARTYVACQDRGQKDVIAHRVILQIEEPGGRFLKQLSYEIEGSLMGATWEQIPRDAALAKVRQALRDMAQLVESAEAEQDACNEDAKKIRSDASQDLEDEDERINELLQLIQVYRENSTLRYHRLKDLISRLEANRSMITPPIPRHHLGQEFLSFSSRKRVLEQAQPSFLTDSDEILHGRSMRGTGRLKTEETLDISPFLGDNPSSLANTFGLAALGGDASQLFRHGSSANNASLMPRSTFMPPRDDNNRCTLLGDMFASQQSRSSAMSEFLGRPDHGLSSSEPGPEAPEDQPGVRQNAGARASSLRQYDLRQSDTESV